MPGGNIINIVLKIPQSPVELFDREVFWDKLSARKREKYLKSTAGKNYLRKINSLKE